MSGIIKGKLKLKGKFQTNKQLKEEKIRQKLEEEEEQKQRQIFQNAFKVNREQSGTKEKIIITYKPEEAEGKIITSQKTVHGQNTAFTKYEKGDFILFMNEETQQLEERKILAILSDKSILIDKEFSQDITEFSEFYIRKQDREQEPEESLEEKYEKQYLNLTKKIKKQEPTKEVLEYRQKKGMWGYKVVKEEVDSKDITKEKLLNMRVKKSRDKFCWI
ncbi:hypothetical protein PPERSA_10112 [Pseudocohnilembus persalinus]|uniref:Uncharacterized protein n=1 Tax=Pseudocohnilembus persalinus TaxID=266149 RepID=A0A0V0R9M7_PSEPJ|nr:hypothetical protein PPERSA_10112 [Pseudocohnilembus persalinus]|eukprot:KRX11180.1 hypothetical protein PPERSA_10112 [Pseudocohnilembus persalinus]